MNTALTNEDVIRAHAVGVRIEPDEPQRQERKRSPPLDPAMRQALAANHSLSVDLDYETRARVNAERALHYVQHRLKRLQWFSVALVVVALWRALA